MPSPLETAPPPAFLQTPEDGPRPEEPLFIARERELVRLETHLEAALAGSGRVVFITGEAGYGKTVLAQEFARRAQKQHPTLVVVNGNCNAHIGLGDPYLPFREILRLLTGDIEAQWAAGAMSRTYAQRLWQLMPYAAQVLVEAGPELVDIFVPDPHCAGQPGDP
jgi:predicted ATPase